MLRYFALNKPFGFLSQFTDEAGHPGLASLGLNLPSDVWSVGRLDRDSEGLLLLTNDMRYRSALMDPDEHSRKCYWVQVEGIPSEADLRRLSEPMELRINKKLHRTRPAMVRSMDEPQFPARNPPIRFRERIPTSWIEITLTEGKNRQVRRMTAHIGYPTLRLIRSAMGNVALRDLNLSPGKMLELSREQAFAARD